MKHIFLPLPIETVRSAWEEWRRDNRVSDEGVHLIEAHGGCFLVTQDRPPKVFVQLLKGVLQKRSRAFLRAS